MITVTPEHLFYPYQLRLIQLSAIPGYVSNYQLKRGGIIGKSSKSCLPRGVGGFVSRKMASEKHNFSSFASLISVLSIVFYCAGFLRVEFKLNEYNKRIHSLESTSGNQAQTSKPSYAPTTETVPGRGLSFRNCIVPL